MGRRCEEWFEEDGGEQLETNDAGEEEMERNNWASQNSYKAVELKKKKYIYIYTTPPKLKNYMGLQNVTTLGDTVRLFSA